MAMPGIEDPDQDPDQDSKEELAEIVRALSELECADSVYALLDACARQLHTLARAQRASSVAATGDPRSQERARMFQVAGIVRWALEARRDAAAREPGSGGSGSSGDEHARSVERLARLGEALLLLRAGLRSVPDGVARGRGAPAGDRDDDRG